MCLIIMKCAVLIAVIKSISAYNDVATGDNINYQFFPVLGTELRFRVRARNDAHIALTTQPKESDPMYEIVIGGWSNTKSIIRRKFTSIPDKCSMQTPQYLNEHEFRGFWIRWDMGIITVGREGHSSPFLAWGAPNPFSVAYAGVHTGYGSNGVWKFDTIATGDNLQYQFFPVTGNSVQFKVRARNDAHIALASQPKEANPMYEIVIGGWSNTRSIIRRRFTTDPDDKAALQTPQYLNEDQFRGFWVRWANGIIAVGREAECSPFLSWRDPRPFSIAYVGVHTGYGSSGLWYFQNANNGQNNNGTHRKYEVTTEDNTIYQFLPSSGTSLRVEVRARNDAHIALAAHPWESDPMYEIVIGGWANTKSMIRRRFTNQPDKVAVQTAKFLSDQVLRGFWVRWDNGIISVGHDIETIPFLFWRDPEPFAVGFVGVHTGYGSSGIWKIEI